jgi:hypothetical protein
MLLIVSIPFFNNPIKYKSIKTANKRYLISNAKNILAANIKDFKYNNIITILKFNFITLKESKVIKVDIKGRAFSKLTKATKDKIYSFKTIYYN